MGRTITLNGVDTTVQLAVNSAVDDAISTAVDSTIGETIDTAVSAAITASASSVEILSNKTIVAPVITSATLNDGYVEEVHLLSSTVLTAANGSIQYVTLSGNTTFTESIADGSSILLMINPATHAVTWPSVVWARGAAPTLDASKFNTIVLWRVGSVMYGAVIGAMG